jgi:hypothetical protein
MALAQIDLANVIARNSAFASNCTHQIADLHSVARSDSHEKTRHAAGRSPRSIGVRRSRLRGWSSMLGRRTSLSALALEQIKRRGSELRGIELLEERLERDDLARRNTAIHYRPQLLSHRCFAIMRPALGTGEVEGREPSTGQLSQPGDLAWSRQHHDLHRFRLSGALEFRRRDGGLEENHRVRRTSDVGLRYANVRVVIVITHGAKSLLCALDGRSIARHDYSRRRVEVVEQAPERGGSGAGADSDVPHDRKLVILRHLRHFHFRRTYLLRPACISLDEVLYDRGDFADHDHSTCVG